MPSFNQQEFNKFIIDNKVVGFFDQAVTLKSGRKSHWYVNWRTVSNDVFLVDRLADFLINYANDMGFAPNAFYGVPEGASKLGIVATYKWAKAQKDWAPGLYHLPMGRGKPKEHGVSKDRFFVGAPSGKIVVVEDVTTTGHSLLVELERLSKLDGVEVVASIGLSNRMELTEEGKSVEAAVAERGGKYYSLSDAHSFLPEAYNRLKPKADIAKAIEQEFDEYGVRPLRLLKNN